MSPSGRAGALFAVLAAVASACGAAPEDRVLARVGDEVLAEADLAAVERSIGRPLSAPLRRLYVERWTDEALLVREARRLGLDRDPDVRREVEAAGRRVLIEALGRRMGGEGVTAEALLERLRSAADVRIEPAAGEI